MFGLMRRSLTTSATSLSGLKISVTPKLLKMRSWLASFARTITRGNPKSSKFNVVNTVASKFSPMATTAASRS